MAKTGLEWAVPDPRKWPIAFLFPITCSGLLVEIQIKKIPQGKGFNFKLSKVFLVKFGFLKFKYF